LAPADDRLDARKLAQLSGALDALVGCTNGLNEPPPNTQPAAAPAETAATNERSRRIYIVCDQAPWALSLQAQLQTCGYEIELHATAAELISACIEQP